MGAIIGTAGWAIPRQHATAFPLPDAGSGLQRYAARFAGVEINSSFYRPHRRSTWERWAASVPEDFRFSAKVPKAITHERRLVDCEDLAAAFLQDAHALGSKLSVLLVQLPPSLALDPSVAETFFTMLHSQSDARIACEPRHASWFEAEADDLLRQCRVARVAADPARVPQAAVPGGWRSLSYWRLHGSPVMYRSPYEADRLVDYASAIEHDLTSGREVWCMFDNTASSAAAVDALELMGMLKPTN
ncbi:DUF72 domain-containing protein [Novosphingobium sp. 9U]|uniref:DUF72 domain-containing protein n=1 Tax=Novosphingobium sp. 9U TaxID=2653158 RepID=UPI001357225B|nr:DUF72 domain-containing protein [Novosphingobium sp. 9U]